VILELEHVGFAVVPGPIPPEDMAAMSAAYDVAVASAAVDDVKVGSTSTRVRDFVNRGAAFDELYVYPPVLAACRHLLKEPFRLSTMHARTLRPGASAQGLHVDFAGDDRGWNMVGFIYMVDEFRHDNGATCFVPGSHLCSGTAVEPILACGPAGSMIVYNGAVWHGHTCNRSGEPRRSIQGAYIRRDAPSGENLTERMLPETLARISPLAKYLLGL